MNIFNRLEEVRKNNPLNKKDSENLTTYKTQDFSTLYSQREEKNIFDIVKSVRKEKNYSPIPIKEDKPESFGNLVINKPRVDSPAGAVVEQIKPQPTTISSFLKGKITNWNEKVTEGVELLDLFNKDTEEDKKERLNILNNYIPGLAPNLKKEVILGDWKKVSQDVSAGFSGVLDVLQKPLQKAQFYGTEGFLYNLDASKAKRELSGFYKEVEGESVINNINSIKDILKGVLSPVDSIATGIAKERINMKGGLSENTRTTHNRIFFGVQPGLELNITSLEENRRQIISSLSGEEKEEAEKFLEDNRGYIIANDVITGVTAGLLTGTAIKNVIRTIPAVSKAKPVLEVAEKFLNPSLNNMAKLGGLFAANAALYYGATGEYVYSGNKAAEEGALAGFLILGLKGLGLTPELVKGGNKFIRKVLSDPQFQNGADEFLGNYAKRIGARADFIDTSKITPQPIPPKKEVYKVLEELNEQQFYKNPSKFKGMAEADDMLELGLDPALFRDSVGFEPKTENIKKLISWGLVDEKGIFNWAEIQKIMPNAKFPFLGKGIHFPKLGDAVKEIPTPKVNPQINKIVESLPEKPDGFLQRFMSNKIKAAKDSGYKWNPEKSDFQNTLNILGKRFSQQVLNLREQRFVQQFGGNNKAVAQLEYHQSQRDIENVAGVFLNKLKTLSPDASKKLPEYLSLKSRLYQARKNPNLKTTIQTPDGKLTLGLKELETYVDGVERKFGSLAQFSELHKNLNTYMLDGLRRSGVINDKQLLGLLENPYYVPGKLTDEARRSLGENLFKPKGNAQLLKKLTDGSEELTFSLEGINDLFRFYEGVSSAVNRNNHIKTLVEIGGEQLKNIKDKTGYTKISYYDGGRVKDTYIPNYYTKKFDFQKGSGTALAKVDSALKQFAAYNKMFLTGPWNPQFGLVMLPVEAIQSFTASAVKGTVDSGGLTSTVRRVGLGIKSKALKKVGKELSPEEIFEANYLKAASQLSTNIGADYSGLRGSIRDAQKLIHGGGIISEGGARKIKSGLDVVAKFTSDLEKHGSRLPNFIGDLHSQVKDKGVPLKKFKEIVLKNYDANLGFYNQRGLEDDLVELGIDLATASKNSRGIYSYFAAGDFFKKLGEYIPYANLVPANAKQLYDFTIGAGIGYKNLSPRAKQQAKTLGLGVIGTIQASAFYSYAHNYTLFKMPYDTDESFEERKKLSELLRVQGGDTKSKAGIASVGVDGRIYNENFFFHNNPVANLFYAFNYTLFEGIREAGLDTDVLFKNIEDLTYFSSIGQKLQEEGGSAAVRETVNKITPFAAKPLIETLINQSLYHGGPVYTEGAGLNPNKNTTRTALFMATAIDKLLSLVGQGSTEGPLGENIDSKINVQMVNHLLKTLNPEELGMIRNIVASSEDKQIANDFGIEGEELSFIRKIFAKSNKITNPEINKLFETRDDISTNYINQQNYIKNTIAEASNREELVKIGQELLGKSIRQYGADHKSTKYIEQKIREMDLNLSGKTLDSRVANLSANVIGKRINDLYKDGKDKEATEILESFMRTQPNSYRTQQVRVAAALYSAKDKDDLLEISIKLIKDPRYDSRAIKQYIKNITFDVSETFR